MKVIFTLPAASIYDNQSRVMGWKHTPSSREELKRLKALAPRLSELGVTRVICSDLDGQSGWYLGRRLNVPVEEWQSLRRFNWGKLHGTSCAKAEELAKELHAKWKDDPTVPVKGGDSQTSYRKRLAAAIGRLLTVPHPPVLVVADARTIAAMLGIEAKLERYRIYEGGIDGAADQTAAKHAKAAS